MTPEESLAAAIDSVERGLPLSAAQLTAVSHLDTATRPSFEQGWHALDRDGRGRLLGQLHAAEANDLRLDFNPIYALALEDPDPEVRRQALDAIVEDPGVTLLDRMARLAREDSDASVREAATRALAPFALMGELGELPPERTAAIVETLTGVLERADESAGPRREALAGLGYVQDDRLAGQIRRALVEPGLRLSAIRAIGRTANPEWLATLAEQATDSDPDVREEVARACGEIADQRALPLAVDLLEDGSLDVRLAAIEALGQIGGEEARDALIYALEDKRRPIREAAESALAQMELEEDPLAL